MPKSVVVARPVSGQRFHPKSLVRQGCRSKMTPQTGKTTPKGTTVISASTITRRGFRPDYINPTLHVPCLSCPGHSHGSPIGSVPPPCHHVPCR